MDSFALAGWAPLAALLVSLALTRTVIGVARRYRLVARPKADRWHQTPTALFGGVAIFATVAAGCLLLLSSPVYAQRYDLFGLLAGGLIVFLVGLSDDIRPLRPKVKLMGQILAALPFLWGIGRLYTYGWGAFAMSAPVLLLWMVGLTNAFNLLDNMDGLCGGAAVIVGVILTAFCLLHKLPETGLLAALVAAACLGFLAFNFRAWEKEPVARIFMGDCGSLFLGYMLAGLTIIAVSNSQTDKTGAVALPLLIMALPIFDTTLVSIIRRLEGRAISQGGKDHSSHRLVYTGLTSKQAVLVLHAISLVGGIAAICVAKLHDPPITVVTAALYAIGLFGFGIFLSRFSDAPIAVTPALE
ncbi:MAG TPA: MraY family glycosyltransferase [Chthonomonadaceae bacterium]|nr:MraY family glycosyltransferase [Chthonomonadaceae bacterium]